MTLGLSGNYVFKFVASYYSPIVQKQEEDKEEVKEEK